MTTWTLISVQTRDHGLVETRCPEWCTGDGHPDGGMRDDISHTGPDTHITVDTPRGPAEMFTFGLAQYPYTSLPVGTAVHVGMFFTNFDGWATSSADLDQLAARINETITTARHTLRRLEIQALAVEGGL